MHSTRSLAATLFLGGVLAWSASSQAALVLADNLSEAGDFYVSVSNDVWQAQAFTNTNATQLTAVELALYSDQGASGDFTIELWDIDAGAGTPGTSLSTLFSGSATTLGGAGTRLVISGLGYALTTSTSYFLVARGISLGVFDELQWLYADDTGGIGFPSSWSDSDDGGISWYGPSPTEPLKLRVEAQGVPLPATLPLLFLGLLALVWGRRRSGQRNQRDPLARARASMPVMLGCVSALLVCVSAATTARADDKIEPAKFRPKEYDVTLITASKNCQNLQPWEGLCQGGNWAQSFTYALHLAKCVKSSTLFPVLSSEELLQCARPSPDPCAAAPRDLDIVTALTQYLTTSGLTTAACLAYQQAGSFELNPACPDQCDDASPKTAQAFASDLVTVTGGATAVQDQILSSGQAILAMRYTQSLNEYESGTLTSAADEQSLGVRFFVVVGWSTSATGEVIWKALGTWGSDYGDNGRVKISSLDANVLAYYSVIPVL